MIHFIIDIGIAFTIVCIVIPLCVIFGTLLVKLFTEIIQKLREGD
jgi:hypothetical protein